MGNNEQPKSNSHKKKKRTVDETQTDLKREKAKNAPPKIPKEKAVNNNKNKRLSEAGDLESHGKNRQKHAGVLV
jgi:hypothetical protein